ncbi:MAG TPA: response regulator [Oligoflexus sp.]|uniref:response regulator n=1 Tax=Oligoflexus sp. TaxID=1971216 RepID=UPI002D2A2BE5|nr:response regulator [Oligoflexus sp.]HYX31536.1 response regulator [Oligoflexus sp.]
MESHEHIGNLDAAALLRQMGPRILSDFKEKLHAQSQCPSLFGPMLPELFENVVLAFEHGVDRTTQHTALWTCLPLASIMSELCLLREVVSGALPRSVDPGPLHRFLDRCLQLAASTRENSENEAHQHLYGFFQLVPIPICVVTGDARRITFSNSAYDNFNRRPAGGKPLQNVFSPDELDIYTPYIDSVFETGKPCFVKEIQVPASIGSMPHDRWVEAAYYPLGEPGHKPMGVIAIHSEVTDRVINRTRMARSELRLKQTEEQLSRAMTVSKVGFFDWDLRLDQIHLNRQMRLDWGTNAESLTPDELEAMIHPDDREQTRAVGRAAIANHTPYSTQCRVVRATDKKVFWIEVQGEITYDDDNRPLRFFGTSRNITERKEAELKLSAEKHKFEVIFRDSPAPMSLWRGPGFVFELANPQFEKFFEGRDLIGKALDEALPEFKEQPVFELFRQVYNTGETFIAQEFPAKVVRSAGGSLEDCYVDFSLTRIQDDEGKPYGVFSHWVNVTDKVKARDEARAASLSKSHFLANMSHEIRTPLAAILGFTALLRDPQLPNAERDVFVDTIMRNGQALTRIIDDILDLAKVEAGRLEMETLDFSLPELIDEIMLLFKDRVRQKNLELSADIEASVPERITSDPLRLRQILVNLVGNAIKFTAKGTVHINCHARPVEDALLITIDVKDTGIGLSSEQITRLFQPFAQADNSTTRKFGGTGLGLALSQRLAEALGGRIDIPFSAPGLGSVFCVQFKACEATAPYEPQIKTPLPSIDSIELRGLRVLAVDDSPDNLFLVKNFLAKSGALVTTAGDGRHAIDLASAQPFDIILLDIQMPEMDGYQVFQTLRANSFKKPIVALTAHAMVDERQHTQRAGFNAHLTKPLDALELVATVARLAHPAGIWVSNGLRT